MRLGFSARRAADEQERGRGGAGARLAQLEVVPKRVEAVSRHHAAALDERVTACAAGSVKSKKRRAGRVLRAQAARRRAQAATRRKWGAHNGSSDCASSGRATQEPLEVCTGISGMRSCPPARGAPCAEAGAAVLRRSRRVSQARGRQDVAAPKAREVRQKARTSETASGRRAAAPSLRRRAGLKLTRGWDGDGRSE